MRNKHLLLPVSHCKYCREIAEDCSCSRGAGILDALALSDIHEKIDWKVKNEQESDTYEAEFIPAILYAQSRLTAGIIIDRLSKICDFPSGCQIRSVEPHHGSFEHNPDCRACKLKALREEYGLPNM